MSTILPILSDTTGRLDPAGAPLHDDLDGLTHHAPSANGQPAGLVPQTNGDGTYTLIPTPDVDPYTAAGAILGATKVTTATDRAVTTTADYDPPTLAVTFAVPASGKVLVHLEAHHLMSAAGQTSWMLRQSGTLVPGSVVPVAGDTTARRVGVDILVEGLTPGQNLTWTWAGNGGGQTSTLRPGAGSAVGTPAPALMVVRDAPFG